MAEPMDDAALERLVESLRRILVGIRRQADAFDLVLAALLDRRLAGGALVRLVDEVEELGRTLTNMANSLPDEVAGAVEPDPIATVKLTVGSTVQIKMSGKQMIGEVVNRNDAIVRVTPVHDDCTSVQVTGIAPGTTHITLTARADSPAVVELIEVIVDGLDPRRN